MIFTELDLQVVINKWNCLVSLGVMNKVPVFVYTVHEPSDKGTFYHKLASIINRQAKTQIYHIFYSLFSCTKGTHLMVLSIQLRTF